MNYHGALICRERQRLGWSQRGLCHGICTVSYLSKIETGKAEPSSEVLGLLLDRLGLRYTPALEAEAAALAEAWYERLFSGMWLSPDDPAAFERLEVLRATAAWLDLELIRRCVQREGPLEASLEAAMDDRQLAMQRAMQDRAEEAARLYPNAYFHWAAGAADYARGSYAAAIRQLQIGHDLAARDGAAQMMLECRLLLGNCYCDHHSFELMLEQYAAARRLALALDRREVLQGIDYNIAVARMERGECEAAYAFFSGLESPGMLELHKLAISCERTGRRDEALAALDAAEGRAPDWLGALGQPMLDVVRMRLEHPDYLKRADYGEALLALFQGCEASLSAGFATFHLPWVLEWLGANRQYKEACRLMAKFPEIGASMMI